MLEMSCVSVSLVPGDEGLLKPFGKHACGIANSRDTNGYRCGLRLAIPFSKRLINSASSSATGIGLYCLLITVFWGVF
jgi:hypothetical protein